MGIPKLFRWLVDLYPSVQQRVSETLGTETAKVCVCMRVDGRHKGGRGQSCRFDTHPVGSID